jgi:hypothetical protein
MRLRRGSFIALRVEEFHALKTSCIMMYVTIKFVECHEENIV